MQVRVEKDLDSALKILKKKLVKEGVFKEIKARKHYEKPSVRRKRKSSEARRNKQLISFYSTLAFVLLSNLKAK